MGKKSSLLIMAVIVIGGALLITRGNRKVETSQPTDDNTSEERVLIEPPTLGTYSLDTGESVLAWSANRIVGNSHEGTVSLKSGSLNFDENGPSDGEFVIDMTRISESNDVQRFLGHIRSDDFFAVEEFPESSLSITNIAESPEKGVYDITGNLTIRDITNEITFPARAEFLEGQARANANFQIDRTRWGINFDSGSIFTNLGDKAIRDEITFSLSLVFKDGPVEAAEDNNEETSTEESSSYVTHDDSHSHE